MVPFGDRRPGQHFDYYDIDQDSPRAAVMVDEIARQIEVLADHPWLGRPGRVNDTRELVISNTPYLRVLHGRQLWPDDMQT